MFHHKINTVKVQMFPYASANNDKIFQKKEKPKKVLYLNCGKKAGRAKNI